MMNKALKIILTILIIVGLTVGLYLVGFKGDWIRPIVEGLGFGGYIVYLLLQIFITTVLCFVPATTFTFTLLSVNLFGLVPGLILSIIGCWISSVIMFLVGRYGGVKLIDWMIGTETRIKVQNQVSDRANVLVPVMLLCPFFPDDAICMISGMTKMRLWYFAITSAITRSVGITATALLGNGAVWNYILTTLGDNIVLWVITINLILFDIWAIWKLSGWIEQLLQRRRKRLKQQEIKKVIAQVNLDKEVIEKRE